MATEGEARQTLELALERQSTATEQLDQRLQREMENALTHKTRADMLTREQTGGDAGGTGSAAGEACEFLYRHNPHHNLIRRDVA